MLDHRTHGRRRRGGGVARRELRAGGGGWWARISRRERHLIARMMTGFMMIKDRFWHRSIIFRRDRDRDRKPFPNSLPNHCSPAWIAGALSVPAAGAPAARSSFKGQSAMVRGTRGGDVLWAGFRSGEQLCCGLVKALTNLPDCRCSNAAKNFTLSTCFIYF